jgi:DNA-binding beta-propeller fold protein YncE
MKKFNFGLLNKAICFGALLLLLTIFGLTTRQTSVKADTNTASVIAGTVPYAAAVNPVTNKIYVTNRGVSGERIRSGFTILKTCRPAKHSLSVFTPSAGNLRRR